jgi:hypothetical protein
MGFKVEYDEVGGLCTLRVVGRYGRPEDTREAQQIVSDLHTGHGCQNVLIDMTQAEVTVDTLTIFGAGDPPPELAAHLREMKSAFLYREITEDLRFFETVATNRGFQVRVFDRRDQALAWLQEG